MTFKDFAEMDLPTFINIEEFGEVIDFDGEFVKAVVIRTSGESLTEYRPKKNLTPKMHGVKFEGNFLRMYVKSGDVKKPRSGEFANVAGIRYKVESCIEAQGILRIDFRADLDKEVKIPRMSGFFD